MLRTGNRPRTKAAATIRTAQTTSTSRLNFRLLEMVVTSYSVAYFGLVQHVEQKGQYREQAGQRRHDAVAQTIQSVVHGSDPPVMQDEPRMGENAKY